MKRTPLKRTPFKRKLTWKKLEPISKDPSRRARRFVPSVIIKQVKQRSGGQCEFVWPDGSRCPASAAPQPHHLKKRSQGGKHTVCNLKDSCWYHNKFAEDEKLESIKLGWTIPG